MKIYITSRFKGAADNKSAIEKLCQAVRDAGAEDFHFIRDVEQHQPDFFATQEQVWEATKSSLKECDALLIDVSDSPSGGCLIEAGMAFALGKPIYVITKKGTHYKDFYTGIASAIYEYEDIGEVTSFLRTSVFQDPTLE